MTVIELAFFLVHVIAGVFLGSLLFEPFGTTGAIGGFMLGFSFSFGLLWASSMFHDYMKEQYPRRPRCRRGECRWDCYRWKEDQDGGALFRCNCGDLYLRKGREFLEVLQDGSTRPYMIKKRFHGWQPVETRCANHGTKSESEKID